MSRTAKLYWAGAALFAIGAGSLLFAATRGNDYPPMQDAAKPTAPSFPATLRPPRTSGPTSTSPSSTSSTTTSGPPATPQTTRRVEGPCNVAHEGTGPLERLFREASTKDGALIGAHDFIRAGGKPRPAGWQPPLQQGFDWTGSGASNGKLVIDRAAKTVSVDWGSGRISVTGIDASIDIGGERSDAVPSAVMDVTGDGRLDLVVFKDDTVAAIAGQGALTPSRSLPFEDIGKLPTEWVSPPRRFTVNRSGSVDNVPQGRLPRTVVPLWDITGDGIDDFALNTPPLGRSNGSSLYYAGQPCQAT